MPSSPARTAANRANAKRSTGPRTPTGKAASSRNALQHGAHAADSTLLSAHAETHAAHLNAYTAHYNPVGPVESLLVRRLATLTLRLDLLADALDSLLALDERRALLEHLHERFGINEKHGSVRGQPSWSDVMRRYDGNTEANPFAGCITSNPIDMPDPHACVLAYTLSSSRAAALFKHEAAAERRFHSTLTTLDHLIAQRRRAALSTRHDQTPKQALAAFDALREAEPPVRNKANAPVGGAAAPPQSAAHHPAQNKPKAVSQVPAVPPNHLASRIEPNAAPARSILTAAPSGAAAASCPQSAVPAIRSQPEALTPSVQYPVRNEANAAPAPRAAYLPYGRQAAGKNRPTPPASATLRPQSAAASSSFETLLRAATRDLERTQPSYLDPILTRLSRSLFPNKE